MLIGVLTRAICVALMASVVFLAHVVPARGQVPQSNDRARSSSSVASTSAVPADAARNDRPFPARALSPAAGGPRRVALVIGNCEYAISERLPLACSDAQAVAVALGNDRFETTTRLNLSLSDMEREIGTFAAQTVHSGDVALMYFAGHGFSVDGTNYWIPVDFRGALLPSQAKRDAVSLDWLSDLLAEQGASLRIVISDACRYPFHERSIGEEFTPITGVGTYVAYSVGSGQSAIDGVFTHFLLQELTVPGLNIDSVFKAVREKVYEATDGRMWPFVCSGLVQGDFFFRPLQANSIGEQTKENALAGTISSEPAYSAGAFRSIGAGSRSVQVDLPTLPEPPALSSTIFETAPELLRLFSQNAAPMSQPDRIAFYQGSLDLYGQEAVLKDRRNPSGVSLPRSDLHYVCNSKTLTCVITAGPHRIEVRRDDAVTYKILERSLIHLM
jgi:hypothetical protein